MEKQVALKFPIHRGSVVVQFAQGLRHTAYVYY